jgi:hypothetical protein
LPEDLQLLKEALPDVAEVPMAENFMQKLKLQARSGAVKRVLHVLSREGANRPLILPKLSLALSLS